MSLDAFTIESPNQQLGAGDPLALMIEEFSGIVEGTVKRRSATEGWLPIKKVTGTATLSKDAIGESTLGKVVPGVTPNSTGTHQFSKNSVTIDTLCYARSTLALLDSFQTKYDVRKQIGMEHGKKIAKFKDTAFLVQGIKAALATESLYGALPGHFGGSQETLSFAADATDPAKLYASFSRLFAQMEEKDIDPIMDNTVIFVRPTIFYALLEAEQVINGEYLTSEGTSVKGHIFKAWGVPVMSTSNLPNGVISTLDDSGNSVGRLLGANYAGDFSKVVALAMSPQAVLAGETISLTSDVFYDKLSKSWYVDAHLSFAATPDRAEYAGAILLP